MSPLDAGLTREGHSLWREYGFDTPRGEVVATAQEAVRVAERIGFPVVLKIESPDVIHKTDVGGVVLGLRSAREVAEGVQRILADVGRLAPGARIEGIRVEEMCIQGVEVIIGLISDPQFGPCIMFGLGGVLTEILEDVSFRVLPLTSDSASEMLDEIKGRRVIEGYRGKPPVSRQMLIDLLLKAGRLGMDLGERLDSVDLNPVVVWGDQHRVLDAKVLLRSAGELPREQEPDVRHLAKFFAPQSVALVGASATPGKIGHAVLDSLIRGGFPGRVYPVNPSHGELLGLRVYPSLLDIPEAVDLVVVTAPLATVPEIIVQCASRSIHNLLIISGGGKELGGENQRLEASIVDLARRYDIRIIGPNCIGVLNSEIGFDTFFQVRERMTRPRAGRIAMITQSGTVGCAFLEAAEHVGVSKFVSYGNRADVDEADLLAYLVEDPSTDVIACYVEGFSDGRKFLRVATRAHQHKPVVVFKSGRSAQGARASVSHTGFFGGRYGVCRGALRQARVVDVNSMEELYMAAKALALQPFASGNRVAMISNGAGTVVQAMDLLESHDLEMATLSPRTLADLRERFPAYFVIQNPIDITGSATAEHYRIGIEMLLEDPCVDIVMPWFVFQDTPLGEDIVEVMARLGGHRLKPIVCGAVGGPYTERMSRTLESAGIPVARSVAEWVAAARALSARQAVTV
jgi:3-hydroxypropionyl-CoA synthetase (ADP-forming)